MEPTNQPPEERLAKMKEACLKAIERLDRMDVEQRCDYFYQAIELLEDALSEETQKHPPN